MPDESVDLFGRPSTADTGRRNAHDYYETPRWMVASLLAHHPIDRASLVLEPCCGDGSIVRSLTDAGFARIITNDLDPRHPARWHRDAAGLDFWELGGLVHVDWVITNPPFNQAIHIVEQAVLLARVGVAMLLRKTFLEPTGREDRPKAADRGPWLRAHPPTHLIGLPRYSFRGSGSDSVSCDWVIWRKDSRVLKRPLAVVEDRRKRSIPPFVIDWRAERREIQPMKPESH